MIKFFDIVESIYTKKQIDCDIDMANCIALQKWLSYDKDNLPYLSKISHFLFYIEPKHFYYLLFCNIPRKNKVPFLNRIEKKANKKTEKLLTEIKKALRWSDREAMLHSDILKQVIVPNEKYWKQQLGISK